MWKRKWRNTIRADSEVITYDVGTNRTEGKGAAHVEVSAVQSQEDFNVVEAIRLNGEGGGEGEKNRHTMRTTLQVCYCRQLSIARA